MRRHAWLGFVAALALVACDDDEPDKDGGPDAIDAGRDGGEDAGGVDAGGDLDAGGDAATDGGDGATCAPTTVTIEESCPTFTACGGAIAEGGYCYEGLCIEEDELLAPMAPFCAGIVIESATGTVTGRVTFLPGNQVERVSVTELEVTGSIPSTCVVTSCDEVGTLTEAQIPGSSANCVMTDECRCEVTIVTTVEVTDSYTVDTAGGTFTVGTDDAERTYEYCVDTEDGSLDFRDSSGGLTEPGIQRIAPDA